MSRSRLVPVALLAFAALACGEDVDWHLKATVEGPNAALPGQVLSLTIDATHQPSVKLANGYYWSCREEWTGKGTFACTLPPGASLDGVFTTGHCGGLGCNDKAKTCPPPPSQHAHVTSQSMPFWSVTPKKEATVTLRAPQAKNGVTTLPQIEVVLDVDKAESQVLLRATTDDGKPFLFDASQKDVAVSCLPHADASGMRDRRTVCLFTSARDVVAPTVLHLTAEATIFAACPRGAASCVAPMAAPGIVEISLRE